MPDGYVLSPDGRTWPLCLYLEAARRLVVTGHRQLSRYAVLTVKYLTKNNRPSPPAIPLPGGGFIRPSQYAQPVSKMKSYAGFANVAGIELTLLDCARYFHKAAGINGVAQIARDIGAKAIPRKLAKVAAAYEDSAVRRLGYLLDQADHERQASALEPFVKQAKTMVPLDPAVKLIVAALDKVHEKDAKWKLIINETVEIAE